MHLSSALATRDSPVFYGHDFVVIEGHKLTIATVIFITVQARFRDSCALQLLFMIIVSTGGNLIHIVCAAAPVIDFGALLLPLLPRLLLVLALISALILYSCYFLYH